MNKNKMKVGTDFSGIGAPEMEVLNNGLLEKFKGESECPF